MLMLPIPIRSPFKSLLGSGVRWTCGKATVDHYLDQPQIALISTPLLGLQPPDDLRAYADDLDAIADAMKLEHI